MLLCGVTLLQFMEKVADRRASEQVVYHLGWKYALDLELDYGGFHATVLVYFRDRLEEKKAQRLIFDGVVDLLIELGLVKRKGKQRLDSTHIVGYVKAMSWMECAIETLRLALEDLKAEVGQKKRPEFWDRLWAFYVENNLDWRLSKTEQANRHRQCGQDIRDLLEWIDTANPKLAEREAVKLVRRVFTEQFEVVEGKLELASHRPSRAVQNPHDPDAHYASYWGRRVPTHTRGRTIAMRSTLMSTSVWRFVPRVSSAPSVAASKIALWEPSTTASSGAINATAVRDKSNVLIPRVDGEL